jgi:hypothetical protein
MESSVIVQITLRLTELLRRRDPLASRVKLSRAAFIGCGVSGVARVLLAPRRNDSRAAAETSMESHRR